MFKIGDKVKVESFNIGDRIKVVKIIRGASKSTLGEVGTIVENDRSGLPYCVNFDNGSIGNDWGWWYQANELELIKEEKKMRDFKVGDRVIVTQSINGAPKSMIGQSGVITETGHSPNFQVKFDDGQKWYYETEELKFEGGKEMEFDKLELKEDLELEVEFEKGVELPREEVATRLQNVVDFVVKENIDARVRVDDDGEVWVHFSTDYSRQDETILDLLTGGKEIETPEQAKVRELKATIEKASKEVSELERSMK